MALRTITNRTLVSGKLAGALLTIAAFMIQPLIALNLPAAFAAGETVSISSAAELRAAIDNQQDNQVWNIAPGQYGVSATSTINAGGQTGWYFPITASNITINGTGNPILYGSGFTANGNWASQDFIAIFGNNVTLNGLTIMPKVQANKAIEVIGANASISNVVITPNIIDLSSPYDDFGGSLYFNGAGNHTVTNVTIHNAGVSFRYSPAGTNITFNGVKVVNTTNVDWINNYRYSSGSNAAENTVTGTISVEYHVSSALNNLDSVMNAVKAGDAVVLDTDITLSKQLTLDKPGVIFNGNGHTVNANFIKTDNSNNSALGIQAGDVTVTNLIVDGTGGTNLHGINAWHAANVQLNDITVQNNKNTGLNVGEQAKVTVNNLTTSNNGWHGVDVDKVGATLTINGVSHHSETKPSVFIDNISVGLVVDTNSQYGFVEIPYNGATARIMNLKLAAPTAPYPANNAYLNTNDFWFTWSAVSGATSYEWQGSRDGTTNADGTLANVQWTGDHQMVQPTNPTAHSRGADGTWYWQVRAVDNLGVKGAWSPAWKMTIDMTAPAAPTGLSWKTSTNSVITNNGATNLEGGTATWQESTSSDVDHYIYKYWNDIPGNPYKAGSEYVAPPTAGTSMPGVFNQGEGVHHFCVVAVDAAGNTSACTQFTITYDKTAPTVSGVVAAFGATGQNQLIVSGTVTDNNLKNYNLRVYNSSKTAQVSPWIGMTGTANVSAGTLGVLDTSVLPTGNYWVRIWADDVAGNRTGITSQIFVPFTVDHTAPAVLISSVVRNADGTFTVSGTTDDNSADVVVAIDGAALPATTPVGGTWSVITGVLTEGQHTAVAISTDAHSNSASSIYPFTAAVVVAVTPPVNGSANTPNTPPVLLAAPTNQGQPLVLGVTQPGTLAVNDGTQTPDAQTTTPADTTPQVLGVNTDNNTDNQGQVLGATDTRSSGTVGLLGLAWYWWLAALAVLGGFWWFIAARRRRKEEDIASFGA